MIGSPCRTACSAAAWTKGGAEWLKDASDLFEEYGWDYCYHSFRESDIWSLEHEGPDNPSLKRVEHDTDRMKVLKAKWALNSANGRKPSK